MNDGQEFLRLRQAEKYLGISERTVRRLVRSGALPIFSRPTDLRERLVRVSDLDGLTVPRPIESSAAPAAA